MLSKSLLFPVIFVTLVGLFACSSDPNQKPETTEGPTPMQIQEDLPKTTYQVSPPLKEVDVDFQTFELKHNEPKTIQLQNGTSIEIPAHAFVDQKGNPITEEVEVRYREFHDAAAVLASGIPMKVMQKNGREAYMQTAGMFEIQAYVAELPVKLAEDKEIMVNMASNVEGTYDFWHFDAEAGQWINVGSNDPAPNPRKATAKLALEKLEKTGETANLNPPVKPIKFDKSKPVLNFDVNLKAFPKLAKMNGLVWQYSGNDPKMNPRQNKWIYKEKWDYVDLQPGTRPNEYQMMLSNEEKKFLLDVCPSQKGKQFEESLAEYQKNLKVYKNQVGNLEAQKEAYQQQASFVRSFAIAGMGIHNYDILLKDDGNIRILADFDFGDLSPQMANMIPVYLISGDRRSVVAFPKHDWDKFAFDPDLENLLIAVLPGNRIAAFTAEDFRKNMESLHNAHRGSYTFHLKEIAEGVQSISDLRGLMEGV